MATALERISRQDRIMMLAYDQGFEHGPVDLNSKNYNPEYILEIAQEGNYTCVALQHGIARKFWVKKYEHIPLVVKLNGKSSLGAKALSLANSSVDEAAHLGATAVGYTIYLGSEHEAEMISEFGRLRKEAHNMGLAVLAWMYPFLTPPSSNDDEREDKIVAYAARVGAELGADVVKIKLPHQMESLPWIIQNAVGTGAIMSGGDKTTPDEFISNVQKFLEAGGKGLAVGRNVWQHENPVEFSKRISQAIWPANAV